MKNTPLFALLLCLAGYSTATAQNLDLSKAQDLYQAEQYAAALSLLEKNTSSTGNDRETADYYTALCRIRLGQSQAGEAVEKFVERYPASTRKAELTTTLADELFSRGQYAQAVKYYDLTDKFSIGQPQRDDYVFRKAYSLYASHDYQRARPLLYGLLNHPKWGSDAAYAFGHICYTEGDMTLAQENFQKVKNHPKYAAKAPFYLANIYFSRKEYDRAIAEALPLLEKNDLQDQDAAAAGRIVGRSYFNTGDYRQALPYLVRYALSPAGSQDDYQIGFAYYKCGDYPQAVQYLSRLLGEDSAVGQNACFVLGQSYLEQGKTTEALGAFRSAARMTHDPLVQQDAWYNYAALSYQAGNPYEPVSKVLAEYLERYPESPLREQVSDYLLDSFISSGEYLQAISTIESAGLSSPKALEALSTACFYLAGERLNQGDYDSALKYYEKASRTTADATLRARADFWASEACLRLGADERAGQLLVDFRANPAARRTKEYPRAAYQQGYLAEKTGDYPAAQRYFSTYEKTPGLSADEKAEVQLHLADCAFAQGQYKQALALYEATDAARIPASDYARYQKALCQGIQGRYDSQIATLTSFLKDYPASPWRASARYQMGIAYQKLQQPNQAIASFLSVADEPAAGELVPEAKSKAALTYYNLGQTDRALKLYQDVVENHPWSAVTPSALRSVRQILIEQGRSDEYVAWSNRTGGTPLDEMATDSLYFETGQKAFSKGDFPAASAAFTRYLAQYPSGLFVPDAAYYLAESSLRTQDTAAAKTAYKHLLTLQDNAFTEGACVKYIDLLRIQDSLSLAVPYLEKLYREARIVENRRFAAANLLAVYFQAEDWDNTIRYAEAIRQEFPSEETLYADASTALYVALVEEQRNEQASGLTEAVKRIVSDENMATVLYYQGLLEYREGNYDQSLKTIAYLTREYPMYKRIGLRALLLMAQNFCAQGDHYQAGYILSNLIENAPDPDIREEARVLKQFIDSDSASANAGRGQTAVTDENSSNDTKNDTK